MQVGSTISINKIANDTNLHWNTVRRQLEMIYNLQTSFPQITLQKDSRGHVVVKKILPRDEVRPSTSRDRSIALWQSLFGDIYADRIRNMDAEQMFTRLMEEISQLVGAVNAYDLHQSQIGVVDFMAWLFQIANKLSVSLEENMQREYCSGLGKSGAIEPYSIIGKGRPESFQDWQKYLKHLYSRENTDLPPMSMVARLLTHIGKASRAVRNDVINDAADSLAKALAWSLAISNKFNFDLDQAVWSRYPGICPLCQTNPCMCVEQKKSSKRKHLRA
jgi:NTP pyrophosphatase (non-canonical NTP hydrolase)